MISHSYVNSTSPKISEIDFLNIMIERMDREVDDAVNEVERLIMESEWEDEIFSEAEKGKLDNKNNENIKKASDSVFSKIGDAVIAVFKKVQEIIEKCIQSLKDFSFRHKNMEDKLNAIKKVDPSHADSLMVEIEKGNINVNDLRSYADIQKAYDEIIEICKKSEIDPDSLKGKAEALKEKIKKIDQSAVVKGAAAAATVGSAIALFAKMRADVGRANLEFQKATTENQKKFLEAYDALKDLNKDAVDPKRISAAQILKNITFTMNGEYGRVVTVNKNRLGKLGDKIQARLDGLHLPNRRSNDERVRNLENDLEGVKKLKEKQKQNNQNQGNQP